MVDEIKIGQETKGTEREGQHRRDDALEQPGRKENGSITAKLMSEHLRTIS